MSGKVKGWCPSAYRPMMSGDGLLVRVRPRMGRLSVDEALFLADLALTFGNGMIDLTSRANLQVRGVREADHGTVLNALIAEGLVEADPERERGPAIVTEPLWQPGDRTQEVWQALHGALPALPILPDKMGFVVDAGPAPCLQEVSGDFRLEAGPDAHLLLVADGAPAGQPVEPGSVADAVIDLANWFVTTGGREAGRMARHIAKTPLPEAFQKLPRLQPAPPLACGPSDLGQVLGVPFGATTGEALTRLIADARPSHIRIAPNRLLILENARPVDLPGFVTDPKTFRADVAACPGAPACASASVETRAFARKLMPRTGARLHVSGCAKGCAHPGAATITLVGRNGRFDLVENGRAGDSPTRTGLSETDLLEHFS